MIRVVFICLHELFVAKILVRRFLNQGFRLRVSLDLLLLLSTLVCLLFALRIVVSFLEI